MVKVYKPLAMVAVASLFLLGCGEQKIDVKGAFGEPAHVSIQNVVKVDTVKAQTITEGTGAEVKSGEVLTYHFSEYNGTTGSQVRDGHFGQPTDLQTYIVGSGQFLDSVLIGKKLGTRLVLQVPSKDLTGMDGQAQSGFSPGDNAVVVIDLVGLIPTVSEGTDEPPVPGMPEVSLAGNEPVIHAGVGEPPKELKVSLLKRGKGPEVKPTDTLIVQYVGALYSDGKVFDSSWKRGMPSRFALSGLVTGVKNGLVGKPAGSRVELVIPPDQAYGDKASGEIPANSTLIFVFDILAAIPGA